MNFSVEKNEILKTIGLMQSIIEKKKTLPILSNILINVDNEKSTIEATDLEITLISKFNCETIRKGSITVPAKKLYDIIKELPNEYINIEKIENNFIRLKTIKTEYKLLGLPEEEFPKKTIINKTSNINIDKEIFIKAISMTSPTISQDDTKFNLCGLYIQSEDNKINFVSTDGHRLSKYSTEKINDTRIDNGIIIPRKGLIEIKKILEQSEFINIYIENKYILIDNDIVNLYVRLIDGEFPNYKKVIPEKNSFPIKLNRQLLNDAVRRISIMSNDVTKNISLIFSNKILIIEASNNDYGTAEEKIEIDYTGDQIKIIFNSRYLLDLFNSTNCENINLYIKDNMSPCLFTDGDSEKFLSVIMPMRL
ncbi:DNA polymerase III subunit beta [Desulfuromonas thiophila]|uniref:DNA polymerase III subunit beta n=1 Tax=Desulfuromonas thiophila TaxID=57664 RepID=UPI0024A890AE|nr:DNA polymerase III subunit beta [Desulfuromonas thiophila]